MKPHHRKLFHLVLAVTVVLTLVVAGSRPILARTLHAGAASSLPTLTLDYYAASNELARTLDPVHIGVTSDEDMVLLVDAGLVHIGTNDKVEPDLAYKWTISKDHKTYTFFIRKNARFANGDYVTASDVKYSIERALAPKTGSEEAYYDQLLQGYNAFHAGKASHLSGVKVINRTTVQIKSTKAVAYFLTAFTDPVNDVLDPAVVGGKNATDTNNYLTNTCAGNQGAGPFKFVCVNKSKSPASFYPSGRTPSYSLAPNPYYYGPKAHIQISMPAYGNPETAYDQYLAGRLAVADIPPDHVDQWRSHPAGQYHTANTSANYWLSLNTKTAPFNDVNCRLAADWAIDRNALAAVLHHTVKPLYTILPPGFPAYKKLSGVPGFSLAKAKAYFAKCKSGNTPVVFKYANTDTTHDVEAESAMMQAVGFHITLKSLLPNDWDNDLVQPLTKSDTQMITNGWTQDYPDPQDYLTNLFSCSAGYNIVQWCNKTFDALTHKADATFNTKTRYKLYNQAQRIALNSAPVIPTFVSQLVYLQKPSVRGLTRTAAYFDVMAKNFDWSKVTVGKS